MAQRSPARKAPVPAARSRRPEHASYDNHHRDVRGGAARAAVFGVSDGLVSNLALILGVAGAHPAAGLIRLAGLAGLIAGSFSMAAGEYVSMRAQRELLERELDLERNEIRRWPDAERRELAVLYEGRGLEPNLAEDLAEAMMRDPERALDAHAREELGIDPTELGSPWQAASSSFLSFALGAVIPLAPFLALSGTAGVVAAAVVSAVAALAIGGALSLFTGRSWVKSALRQFLISAVAAGVTYSIGTAVGVSGIA
ncbi:MAG: VIT1/CCC1 transporter family protein [Acidimicrobiales bacterium]|nr:VIT1/CCC1 transporter family protein [Acidimicrobiales bacterium]MBO0893827.1 VIT1/CCC1 transporter family protein [Acidimicrobiales bacterium]